MGSLRKESHDPPARNSAGSKQINAVIVSPLLEKLVIFGRRSMQGATMPRRPRPRRFSSPGNQGVRPAYSKVYGGSSVDPTLIGYGMGWGGGPRERVSRCGRWRVRRDAMAERSTGVRRVHRDRGERRLGSQLRVLSKPILDEIFDSIDGR
jgi:hypothetical protein